MSTVLLNSTDYARIERAIVYLAQHFREQPSLPRIAAQVGLSAPHFNRLFHRWAGVTPKQFVQRLTLDAAKWQLQQAHSVMRAALESGLSGPGRLHDLFVTLEAITPGEFKSGGAGLQLAYGTADTPFGAAWLVWSERGLCQLQFVDPQAADDGQHLHPAWPGAQWQRDDAQARQRVQSLWQFPTQPDQPLRLLVQGSNFQLQVWRALLKLGADQFTDYGALAAQLHRPGAARAVGNAVGANPLLCLIPCHRVLRANGGLGGYAAGIERKQVILAWEYAHSVSPE
jgi:AraC family transcriptional regulator, regulatory protein of adaptative response / methylated-DNA-[protein]-cysteine methyltransferase